MFPQFVWNVETTEKVIYLTFDDGPTSRVTPWVLETLAEFNAKATFFCIGNNIEKNPELFKEVIRSGNAVGNHTFNHLKGWKTKTKKYLKDVKQSEFIMQKHLSTYPEYNYLKKEQPLFRPPYGKFKMNQARQLLNKGYRIVLWDVLSFDWDANTTEETCYNNVIGNIQEGSIVVFHDSLKAEKNLRYCLPKTLTYYSAKGFRFKAL